MVQTAVLGYGTVGSGVVKVIDTNHDSILAKAGVDLQVKYILDLREFPGDPNAQKVVHDVEVILQDPGGSHCGGDDGRRGTGLYLYKAGADGGKECLHIK